MQSSVLAQSKEGEEKEEEEETVQLPLGPNSWFC